MVYSYEYHLELAEAAEEVRAEVKDPHDTVIAQPTGVTRFATSLDDLKELATRVRRVSRSEGPLQKLGEALFEALFDESLATDFRNRLESVEREPDTILRVQLDVDADSNPDIAALPWELIRAPQHKGRPAEYLATHSQVVFSRRRRLWNPPAPVRDDASIRILLVVSSPRDQPPIISIERQLRALEAGCPDRFKLLDVLADPKPSALDEALRDQEPDVLHFIGHGELRGRGSRREGALAFVGPDEHADWIGAEDFATLLQSHRPSLVILQACNSATVANSRALGSVAAQCVQRHTPMVLALQYPVSNNVAVSFFERFYPRLLESPVDLAVQQSRRGNQQDFPRKRHFSAFVLFASVSQNNLFPLSSDMRGMESVEEYKAVQQRDWLRLWEEVDPTTFVEPQPLDSDKTPFITTQACRVLQHTTSRRRHLYAEQFRAGGGIGDKQEPGGRWHRVNRAELTANEATEDFLRLVLTTDAGVGKTANLQWLNYSINAADNKLVCFLLNISQLANAPDLDSLLVQSVLNCCSATSDEDEAEIAATLDKLRGEGSVVLLFDALDQLPGDGSSINRLREVCESRVWSSCRIVVAGRPHSIQRYWIDLFEDSRFKWHFVSLDEFTEHEQRFYLGVDSNGEERYSTIPEESRDILTVPRVLSYLRELPYSDLDKVHTSADVYWLAVKHMVVEGMKNSAEGRKIGTTAGEAVPRAVEQRMVECALRLLGAIAFQMTVTRIPFENAPRATASDGDPQLVPNFDSVQTSGFAEFKDAIHSRLTDCDKSYNRRLGNRDIDSLSSLNGILQHGFFESEPVGLSYIVWRNRTLQEFLTAYWMANYLSSQDADEIVEWVCARARPLSEEYYWVWRFLSEMPEGSRKSSRWAQAVAPLFQRNTLGVSQPRPTEMIFRCWNTLQTLCDAGNATALAVHEAYTGEFQAVFLSGQRGEDQQAIARQFCDSFQTVETGTFQMGSPPSHQGIPAELLAQWEETFDSERSVQELVEEHLSDWGFSPGRIGEIAREREANFWTKVLVNRDMKAIEQRDHQKDETPEIELQQVAEFQLCKTPTMNDVYRMFEPAHGLGDSYFAEEYALASPDGRCAAVHVTWYDAWAFCQWARWEGGSCRLPREHEWEYAARAGSPWEWKFWWGDEMNFEKCNCNHSVERATAPSPEHGNDWGFQDILGNVWEWTVDKYRSTYSLDSLTESGKGVLRGGSWGSYPSSSRCAVRNKMLTRGESNIYVGFRAARDLLNRTD